MRRSSHSQGPSVRAPPAGRHWHGHAGHGHAGCHAATNGSVRRARRSCPRGGRRRRPAPEPGGRRDSDSRLSADSRFRVARVLTPRLSSGGRRRASPASSWALMPQWCWLAGKVAGPGLGREGCAPGRSRRLPCQSRYRTAQTALPVGCNEENQPQKSTLQMHCYCFAVVTSFARHDPVQPKTV